MSANKRIRSNLLQQNCFVRDISAAVDLAAPFEDSTFVSLDEKVTESGLEFSYNEYPYHITPQYVNSFAEGADYHRDPLSAISSSAPRVNLNDIRNLQDVSSMDTEQSLALFKQLQAKFAQTQTQTEIQTQTQDSEVK